MTDKSVNRLAYDIDEDAANILSQMRMLTGKNKSQLVSDAIKTAYAFPMKNPELYAQIVSFIEFMSSCNLEENTIHAFFQKYKK